ncbi:MAG TPA: hypothetical protein PKY13_04025 [Microthrixaceae bacterium]|nr:hypothetical protein [Microthrixaceae bacterium]
MTMKPGDWVAIDGYDADDASMAVVVATSRSGERLDEEAVAKIASGHDHQPVRAVTWHAVLVADHDNIGDDNCEFHEHGTGTAWVEAILCREVIE